MIDNNTNQTQFAAQEPIMESLSGYEPEISTQEVKPKKKKSKLIIAGIIAFILIVVFILLLVLISSMSSPEEIETKDNGNVIENIDSELDPLLKEVYVLSQDLEIADPSLNTIPFPPVDMELRLDDPKRR